MDRNAFSDRLPTDPLPTSWLPTGRLPGLSGETDDAEAAPVDTVGVDSQAETDPDSSVEIDLEDSDDTPSRREKLRKLLLVTALGGLGLAVLAALLRRVIGGSDSEDDADFTDDAESESLSEAFETTESDTGSTTESDSGPTTEFDTEPSTDDEVDVASELLTADAEGVAAMVGLGFHLLVRALVGEDESESPTA